MREEAKPFVCYAHGWSMKIMPRNAAGWQATGIWIASLLVATGTFVAFLVTGPDQTVEIVALGVSLVVTAAWSIATIRWMLARSAIVDYRTCST